MAPLDALQHVQGTTKPERPLFEHPAQAHWPLYSVQLARAAMSTSGEGGQQRPVFATIRHSMRVPSGRSCWRRQGMEGP